MQYKNYSQFSAKIPMYLPYFKIEILTSRHLVISLSFEQLGPEILTKYKKRKLLIDMVGTG